MADKNQSHSLSGFLQFDEKNNLEINKDLLIQYRKDLESLELWKSIKELKESDKDSELYCMKQTSLKIEKCFKVLEQGYLITAQLEDIKMDTEDFWYNEECDESIVDVPITDLIGLLKQFKFKNYQEELAYFIKQNVGWRQKDREFEIYKEIKEGKLYSELSNELDLTISAISKINKKVQSSINNLKGKFFEIEYEKYLKYSDKFRNCEIVRDGNPGKPDIYIVNDAKKDLYIFSLKNLEINKKSFCITTEQLKPELKFAYNNSISKKFNDIFLILVVFDSLTKKLDVIEINYEIYYNISIIC